MFSVNTGALMSQAEKTEKESSRYTDRVSTVDESISWLRQQEFREADVLCRTLLQEKEELETQKKALLLLSGALRTISETYIRTEERIADGEGILWNENHFTETSFIKEQSGAETDGKLPGMTIFMADLSGRMQILGPGGQGPYLHIIELIRQLGIQLADT